MDTTLHPAPSRIKLGTAIGARLWVPKKLFCPGSTRLHSLVDGSYNSSHPGECKTTLKLIRFLAMRKETIRAWTVQVQISPQFQCYIFH